MTIVLIVYKCICDSYDITATGCRDKVPVHPGRRFRSTSATGCRDRVPVHPGRRLWCWHRAWSVLPLTFEYRDGELALGLKCGFL